MVQVVFVKDLQFEWVKTMGSSINYSSGYDGRPSYIYENCYFTTTYLQVEDVQLRNHFIGVALVLLTATPAAVIFNLLTILTFIYRIKFRVTSRILLCAVAVTDMITGLTAIPMMGTMHLLRYLGKTTFCPLFLPGYIFMFTALLLTFVTLTMMSVDKYLAIFYPFKYNARVDKQTLMIRVLVTLWTLVTLFGVFTIFTPKLKLITEALFATFCVFLPLTIFVHIRIFYKLRKRKRQIHTLCASLKQQPSADKTQIRKFGTQGVRVATTVIVVLIVCYLPATALGILRRNNLFDSESDVNKLIQYWTHALVLLNSLMNPFIYCWQLKGFRKSLFSLLRKSRTAQPATPSVSEHSCSHW